MNWVSPTGFTDPDSAWTNETNAYDDDTSTYTECTVAQSSWGSFIELTFSAVYCDKIRFYAYHEVEAPFEAAGIHHVDIDAYYEGAWHNVYQGRGWTSMAWVEKSLVDVKQVTKARLRFYNTDNVFTDDAKLYEFDVWEAVMNLVDTNELIRTHLLTSSVLTDPLIALIGGATPRLYCPRLPENATLPAISFLTRGGSADPEVTNIFSPSVQFDCWASNPIDAREIYRALYNALQGLGNAVITIDGRTYHVTKAREEVQGQDLVDSEIPNYFRVMTFYSITVRDNL